MYARVLYAGMGICVPEIVGAFDYGTTGNAVFWVVLGVWSMVCAYILLTYKQAILNGIGAFTHTLFAREPRHRVVRNPHISVMSEPGSAMPLSRQSTYVHTPVHSEQGARGADTVYVLPPHIPQTSPVSVPPPSPQHTPVQSAPFQQQSGTHEAHHTSSAVVHLHDMSDAPLPVMNPLAPKVPANEVQGEEAGPKTVDALTLQIVDGVPRLVLRRGAPEGEGEKK